MFMLHNQIRKMYLNIATFRSPSANFISIWSWDVVNEHVTKIHTLEKQAGVMVKDKRNTEKKWNPSATLTQADRKDLAAETNKSAITDHVAKNNHVIDWSGAKILDRGSHRKTRQLKESICIREEVNCINRDGAAYNLPMTYDHILVTCSLTTSRDHMPDEVRRWGTKRRNI